MPNPVSLRKKSGFTLVEAFVAMSILTFCATALFASLYIGFNLVNDIREHIIASSIIQQEMESLRKTPFVTLPSYGDTPFTSSSLSRLYNSSAKVNIGQYVDSNIVRAVVTVTWYSRLNTTKQNVKKVITLITKNGINSI
ncbi:MAG: type II secretion system protein [Candidatus Omnitrophica bacterium]|nr:type II secretion system protein [Candidatus Omnitrophota bacterium]